LGHFSGHARGARPAENNVEGNSKKAGNWFESGRNRSSFPNASLGSYAVDTHNFAGADVTTRLTALSTRFLYAREECGCKKSISRKVENIHSKSAILCCLAELCRHTPVTACDPNNMHFAHATTYRPKSHFGFTLEMPLSNHADAAGRFC
jgi:hypothetical protein